MTRWKKSKSHLSGRVLEGLGHETVRSKEGLDEVGHLVLNLQHGAVKYNTKSIDRNEEKEMFYLQCGRNLLWLAGPAAGEALVLALQGDLLQLRQVVVEDHLWARKSNSHNSEIQ